MTDNELFTLARSVIVAGLAARGYDAWKVARKFQPQQAGANTAPTVYLFKVADKRHGFPQRKYVWDEDGQQITAGVWQQYETTLQASVELIETTDPNGLTPSDALSIVAAIMQSDDALSSLQAQQVGLLRITAVTNPYNENDFNRFDAGPSFDFVLTHRRGDETVTPFAVTVESSINRV